jgi:hypothetical protein
MGLSSYHSSPSISPPRLAAQGSVKVLVTGATDTLSKEIGGWQASVTNIKARLPELPQLGPTVQELEERIVEGEEIQSIQDVQRSELRETNRRSREIRRRGRSLRNKPAVGVQSVFGVDSRRCWPSAPSRACRSRGAAGRRTKK